MSFLLAIRRKIEKNFSWLYPEYVWLSLRLFVSYIVVIVRMFSEFDYCPSSISDGVNIRPIPPWSWDERPGLDFSRQTRRKSS